MEHATISFTPQEVPQTLHYAGSLVRYKFVLSVKTDNNYFLLDISAIARFRHGGRGFVRLLSLILNYKLAAVWRLNNNSNQTKYLTALFNFATYMYNIN